jgi:hypothetical protein
MVRAALSSSASTPRISPTRRWRPQPEENIMANDHSFDCQQCGAHFDTRDQLERHNKQQHTPQTQQAGSSSMSSSSRNQSNVNRDINSRDRNS